MDLLLTNYPTTFTLVQIYMGCAQSTEWGNLRYDFYGATFTPWAVFDGVEQCAGSHLSLELQYNWYEQKYLARQSVPTDVTITLTGYPLAEQTYRINVRICLETDGTSKTVRLYIAQLLDHWPPSPTWCRHGFKQVAGPSPELSLTPGECYLVTRDLTFDPDSWAQQDDIRIVAWAQQPQATSPAEVFQAATIAWPFPPDCNANGVPDPEDVSSGASTDVNGNGVPDECESVGDLNCDLLVNAFDIDPFVLALTNPSGYAAAYPDCDLLNADANGDGAVNTFDVDPFVVLVCGG